MQSFIILGAGAPFTGEEAPALKLIKTGKSMIQWQADAARCKLNQIVYVAGYQLEAVKSTYPSLNIVENQNWVNTGSAASLLMANLSIEDEFLVCYGDILFRPAIVQKLKESEADISIAWDSAWKTRFTGRKLEDLKSTEKVMMNGREAVKLGQQLTPDWAHGEFIGLAYFSKKAANELKRLKVTMPKSLLKCHLSDFIDYLRCYGLRVEGFDVKGDWAELNEIKDIARFILGTKAQTLSRLQGIIKNAVIQDQISLSVAEWKTDSKSILTQIKDVFKDNLLVVRSSAQSEDSFTNSNAGGYKSFLNIDPKKNVSHAIQQVIDSYGVNCIDDDQVLIQPMLLNVKISGVAFTRTLEHHAPWYVINYETSGDTEAITSGNSANHQTCFVGKESYADNNIVLPDERLKPLLDALNEIEELLGYDSLDVEFAIDSNNQVHILQVRPIAVRTYEEKLADNSYQEFIKAAKNSFQLQAVSLPHIPGSAPPLMGAMPDWNPAEIIGTSPGLLAISLYKYLIMDDIWAQQRFEFGYRDARPAPLLHIFSGQPYVDVRASFTSFIPAVISDQLAGKLLNYYLNELKINPHYHDKIEFKIVPTCLGPNFKSWENKLSSKGNFSKNEINEIKEGLRAITCDAFVSYTKHLDTIRNLDVRYRALMSSKNITDINLLQALLEECKIYGTLPFAHLARCAFVAMTFLQEAVECGVISQNACDDFLSTIRTVSHDLTNDARKVNIGLIEWEKFVQKYGHLRPGTYDITSPRYDQDPEIFLRPIVLNNTEPDENGKNLKNQGYWESEKRNFATCMGKIGLPNSIDTLEKFMREAIEGRELAKFVFTRNLSMALEVIAKIGKKCDYVLEDLSHLSIHDIFSIENINPSAEKDMILRMKIKESFNSTLVASNLVLPALITTLKDLDCFVLGADQPNFVGNTTINAEVVNISNIDYCSEINILGKIVIIPQADPGYDWLFGQRIAGVITLYGGANSHMAIRAAEFRLPAAIGVGPKRYQEILHANRIELSPQQKLIRILDK